MAMLRPDRRKLPPKDHHQPRWPVADAAAAVGGVGRRTNCPTPSSRRPRLREGGRNGIRSPSDGKHPADIPGTPFFTSIFWFGCSR